MFTLGVSCFKIGNLKTFKFLPLKISKIQSSPGVLSYRITDTVVVNRQCLPVVLFNNEVAVVSRKKLRRQKLNILKNSR